jgi:hypothetical protein
MLFAQPAFASLVDGASGQSWPAITVPLTRINSPGRLAAGS